MKLALKNPSQLAILAIMIALVIVLTRPIVPTPVGYTHLGDTAIYFAAFAFGPLVGAIAGGVGTAIADLLTGAYASFAPLSLLVHGLQGFLAGYLYYRLKGTKGLLLGTLTGAVIVVLGYFIGEALVPIWGGPGVAISEIPFNLLQVLIGSSGGALYLAVARAYPRLGPSGKSDSAE